MSKFQLKWATFVFVFFFGEEMKLNRRMLNGIWRNLAIYKEYNKRLENYSCGPSLLQIEAMINIMSTNKSLDIWEILA